MGQAGKNENEKYPGVAHKSEIGGFGTLNGIHTHAYTKWRRYGGEGGIKVLEVYGARATHEL